MIHENSICGYTRTHKMTHKCTHTHTHTHTHTTSGTVAYTIHLAVIPTYIYSSGVLSHTQTIHAQHLGRGRKEHTIMQHPRSHWGTCWPLSWYFWSICMCCQSSFHEWLSVVLGDNFTQLLNLIRVLFCTCACSAVRICNQQGPHIVR